MSNRSEQIAKILCNKPDNITCKECFDKLRSQICEDNNNCRISEKNPEQLCQIKGIGQKSIEKWTTEIQKNIGKKYAILELLEYGLTQKQCMK